MCFLNTHCQRSEKLLPSICVSGHSLGFGSIQVKICKRSLKFETTIGPIVFSLQNKQLKYEMKQCADSDIPLNLHTQFPSLPFSAPQILLYLLHHQLTLWLQCGATNRVKISIIKFITTAITSATTNIVAITTTTTIALQTLLKASKIHYWKLECSCVF